MQTNTENECKWMSCYKLRRREVDHDFGCNKSGPDLALTTGPMCSVVVNWWENNRQQTRIHPDMLLELSNQQLIFLVWKIISILFQLFFPMFNLLCILWNEQSYANSYILFAIKTLKCISIFVSSQKRDTYVSAIEPTNAQNLKAYRHNAQNTREGTL